MPCRTKSSSYVRIELCPVSYSSGRWKSVATFREEGKGNFVASCVNTVTRIIARETGHGIKSRGRSIKEKWEDENSTMPAKSLSSLRSLSFCVLCLLRAARNAIDIAVLFPKKCNGRVLSTDTPAKSVESGAINQNDQRFFFSKNSIRISRSFLFSPDRIGYSFRVQKNGTLHEVVNNLIERFATRNDPYPTSTLCNVIFLYSIVRYWITLKRSWEP